MSAIMNWFSGEFFSLLGWTLLHSLWQGAIIALLYGLALMLLRRQSAPLRYLVSLVFLLLIPVTSLITMVYLHIHSPSLSVTSPFLFKISPLSFFIAQPGLESPVSGLSWESMTQFFNSFISRNLPLVNFFWMTGFLVFGLRFMGGMIFTQRLKHRRTFRANAIWQQKIEHLSQTIGIGRPVRLMESLLVKMPVVVGYFKPVILVPLGIFSQIPPEQISAILTHELAHIYRRDYLINLLQTIIEAFFFFHPAVWWISNQIRTEREYICDDITLKAGHDPLIYSKALTRIEELQWKAPAMVAAIAGNRFQLLNRIKRILEPRYKKPTFSGGFIMLLFVIGVMAVTTTAAIAFDRNGSELQTMNDQLKGSSSRITAAQFAGILPLLPSESLLDPEEPSPEAEGWQNSPDTTKPGSQKQHDEAVRQFEEAQKALQEAETRMQEAKRQQWEAQRELEERYREQQRAQADKYREAIREYEERIRESVREYQKKLQELYSNDSLDTWAPFMQLPDIYEEYPWLFYLHEEDDSALRQFFFLPPEPFDYIPAVPDELPDLRGSFIMPPMPELPALQYYTFPDCEELEKEMETPDLLGRIYMPSKPRIREVIWNELIDDGLIEAGEAVVVNISPRSMTINGEKQNKEFHRKYKTLLEKSIGDIGSVGYTCIY